jgi:hypothetical protein
MNNMNPGIIVQTLISAIVICSFYSPLTAAGGESFHTRISCLINDIQDKQFHDRFITLSDFFTGRPYVGGPLGEGATGLYDRDPIYRFDCFDCTTLVETVLALSHSASFDDFKELIVRIRYERGKVSFVTRNHVTSIDWNRANSREGFLRDVTGLIGRHGTRTVSAVIDKRSWYQSMKYSRLDSVDSGIIQKGFLLRRLRNEGRKFTPVDATIDAIVVKDIVDDELFRSEFMGRLPESGVINFVRPGWDIEKHIGTELLVAHQGIIYRKGSTVYLVHASSKRGMVVSLPLLDQLLQLSRENKNWHINILEIVPGSDLDSNR